jgi:hypothetical protein
MSDRDVGQSDGEAHDLPTELLDDTSDSHAVWFGFWDAMKHRGYDRFRWEEAMAEPHYYQLGYVAGRALQALGVGAVVTIAYLLATVPV